MLAARIPWRGIQTWNTFSFKKFFTKKFQIKIKHLCSEFCDNKIKIKKTIQVMECQIINYKDVTSKHLNKLCRKLSTLEVYAGLLMFFVQSAICESDWPQRLTYDEIYNSTSYAQIPNNHRPYTPVSSFVNSHKYTDVTKGDDNYLVDDKVPLLVGFARDPFRYSVPDEDYRKGVRHINPQSFSKNDRGKRGVFHLYNMLYCGTGCDPLSYKGYGCYCGFLGAGRPTDGIDRCCKIHDQCYENIYCPFFTVYFQPYYWKCYRGEPLCALENYSTQDQFVNGCAGRLCECDRQFAMCIRRYQCPRGRALCRSSPIRLLQNILMLR